MAGDGINKTQTESWNTDKVTKDDGWTAKLVAAAQYCLVIGIHRLPVVSLIDYLMGGYTVEEFLDMFPGTDPDKVMAILQMIKDKLEEGWMAVEVDY